MAARRPFDASFSRRGGGGGGSLMGEYSGPAGSSRAYDYEPDRPDRVKIDREREDLYQERDRGSLAPSDYGHGWRGRSPEPRYSSGGVANSGYDRERERDRGDYPVERSSWGQGQGGGGGHSRDREDRFSSQPQQRYAQAAAPAQFQTMRNPEQVVMMLPSAGHQAGLVGSLGGMGGGNPFVQPMMVAAGGLPFGSAGPFAQQLGTPFGAGIAAPSAPPSIYGPQTQQGFDRPRNLISAPDNDGRRRGDRDRDRGRDRYGHGQGRRSETSRHESPRKRNLVQRDPYPEDLKRARLSSSRKDDSKVKRVNLEEKDRDRNRSQSGRRHSSVKKSEKNEDTKPKDKENGEVKEKGRKEEKERGPTEYDSIPGSLLVCKVCQKSMNDGQSFNSHLSGKAHLSLLKLMEERFAKRSELLMHENKCAEEEIGIEMDRQRRAGASKAGRAEKNASNFCKMCDCYYAVNWGTHKVSLGHRILKEFLHPTCHICNTHFMHRKDWVTHILGPSHLQKLAEIKAEGSVPLEEHESTFQDELFTIHVDLNREERVTNVVTVKALNGKESLTEEMKEILKNDRGEIVLPEGEIPIPKEYSSDLTVGADAVVAVNGNRCRVCRVYIPEEKSVDEHCSSREHFNQYVSFLKRVNRHREHKEREKKEAEEKAKRDEERAKRKAEGNDIKIKDEETNTVNGDDGNAKGQETNANDETKTSNNETQETKTEEIKYVEVIDVDEDADDDDEMEGYDGYEDDVKADDDDEEKLLEDEEDHTSSNSANVEEQQQEQTGHNAEEIVTVEEYNDADGDEDDVPKIIGVRSGVNVSFSQKEEPSVVQTENVATEPAASAVSSNPPVSIEDELDDVVRVEEQPEAEPDETAADVPPAAMKTPAPSGRARRGRGTTRGAAATPSVGRTTPALRNVQPKVDTNIRGRGAGRTRSPRGGRGRGAR